MVRAGLEPVTSGFQIRRPNHLATLPPLQYQCSACQLSYQAIYHDQSYLHPILPYLFLGLPSLPYATLSYLSCFYYICSSLCWSLSV